MKILFVTNGELPDYQSDTLMHGGRSLFGPDFVDSTFAWYMYKKERAEEWNRRAPNNGNSYGRGFTLAGSLPSAVVDRTDIVAKIKARYFDYIVYGSATRCLDYMETVVENYPKNKIIFVDGEDDTTIRTKFKVGVLFKRELISDEAFPISFAAPREKVVESVPEKTQDWATVVPGQLDTYIFTEEEPYYKDYQRAMFAITHKKAGWDCLRHYEILMNGCVPHFRGVQDCPANTMRFFPKSLCLLANDMIASGEVDTTAYLELAEKFLAATKRDLTTEAVFKYMLDKTHE